MKKIFNSLFVIIASMVAFSACVKEENSPASETKTVQFFAESIETKTAFGTPDGNTYPTLWTANDEKVCVALNDMDGKDSDLEISPDFKTARFETQFADNGGTSYKFFALSPASAKNSMSSSVLSANIWNAQTPLANSVDERAQVLYAVSDAYSAFPASVNMVFKHFTAYGKLSFANVNLNGAKMTSVTIESSVNIAGRWNYNVNSGEYTENSGSSAITLNTTATENIWFACAPVDMDGQSLTFIINTDKGPLSKTVTLSGKKFEAGKIAKMVVDMSDAKFAEPVVFELVTDVNDLTVGSEIIIAASESNVAISTTQNGNNRAEAAITKSGDKSNIVDPASGVQVITVKEGKTAGTFAFNVGNGYLYAASSSSNYLRTETNLSANSSWTVTIASTGVATIQATGSNTRNLLKYNTSSKLFSCYSSDQADVVIYKKRQQSGPETPTPEERNLVSISVSDDAKIEYGVGAEFVKPTVTASYDDNSTADVTASATFSGYDMNTTGTHTVTVSYAENDVTATTTYTITVSENEEPDEPTDITVADFLELKNTATEYILTGKITRVANESYGNFDLTDATGTVYVYGLLTPDGVAQKQWAAAGLKQGDIITVKGVYNEYNGSSQIKNAVYVSHKGISVDKTSYTFAAEGGSFEVTATLVNASDAVSVSVDNSHFTCALKSGTTYTVTAPANQTAENIYANLTFIAGELSVVVAIAQDAPAVEGEVPGGRDDFNTVNANTAYNLYTTTAGWQAVNCAVLQGGTKDSNPTYQFIGSTSATRAFCMNGKTSAKGTITSPTLTTGCGTLKFNYGLPFSDTKIKFKVEIKQNGTVVKTITIDNSSASKTTKYSHEESVNVSGDFQIVFTNLSPSNSTSNKDRTAVWDVEWTGCN